MSDPYLPRPGQPARPWAYAQPPQPATPYAQPQPYHRLLRTRRYRPWQPLVMLVVGVGVYLLLALLALLPWLISVLPDIISAPDLDAAEDVASDVTPLFLLSTNLSLAAAIPAAMIALLAAARLRPGWLGSVTGRLRWRLLLRTTGYAAVLVVVFYALSLLLPVDAGAEPVETLPTSTVVAFLVVVALTTPLQAAGEEYAFRGWLAQWIGGWVPWSWVGGLVSATLFAFAHGSQNAPLFLDRFAFGLVAWILVVRTGGLEASIALHAVNNLVVLGVASLTGQVASSLTVSEAPWSFVVLDIAQLAAFAWLVEVLVVRRRGVATRSPAAEPVVAVPDDLGGPPAVR